MWISVEGIHAIPILAIRCLPLNDMEICFMCINFSYKLQTYADFQVFSRNSYTCTSSRYQADFLIPSYIRDSTVCYKLKVCGVMKKLPEWSCD